MQDLNAYEFFLLSNVKNNYSFITNSNVEYLIKFKPFPYLFDAHEPYSADTFEFAISVYKNQDLNSPSLDPNIGPTIASIFDDFNSRNSHTIPVYICDTSDGREFARMRKFNYWFDQFNTEIYFKSDIILFSKDVESTPTSIILRRDNPYKYQIIEAFEKLTDGYNQK